MRASGSRQRALREQQHRRIDHAAVEADHTTARGLTRSKHAARPVNLGRRGREGRIDRRHLGGMNTQLGTEAAAAAAQKIARELRCVLRVGRHGGER